MPRPTTDHLPTNYAKPSDSYVEGLLFIYRFGDGISKVLHGFTWSLQINGQIIFESNAVNLKSTYTSQDIPY
jgi:hypothetical protein